MANIASGASPLSEDTFDLAEMTAAEIQAAIEQSPLGPEGLQFLLPLEAVDVAPPGHAIPITWNMVAGATRAEVEAAATYIGPAVVEESLGELPLTADGYHSVVAIAKAKRIAKLNLEGLAQKDGDSWISLNSASDLSTDGPRLVVSIEDPSAGWIPLYAVPHVPSRGVLPHMFSGATFENGVLTLPAEVAAPKLRLSLVRNEYPEDFEVLEMGLDRVLGWAKLLPRNLEMVGPDGVPAWTFPGELPANAPIVTVDLRFACESALNGVLKAGSPLDATFHLRGESPGNADFLFTGVQGALVRAFPGVLRTELAGDPELLGMSEHLKDAPLADEEPSLVIADLTVCYEGIRLLETVADPAPETNGDIGGAVVTNEPVVRALPLLGDLPVVRAGLIGRAPEPCELAVQLVDMATSVPLGPPGVIKLEPAAVVDTVWIDLPEIEVPAKPVGLSAHTNRGRFFWVEEPEPLLRLAVRDPDPGGRPLLLDGEQILTVTADEYHLPADSLPQAAFRSSPPTFESSLFLTVDLSDLTLRYQR